MTTDVAAGEATERLCVKVTLTVQHSVTVTIDADSGQSMEDLKRAALEEFHLDPKRPYERRSVGRARDTWAEMFNNRSNIDVGSERVSIASLSTEPAKSY